MRAVEVLGWKDRGNTESKTELCGGSGRWGEEKGEEEGRGKSKGGKDLKGEGNGKGKRRLGRGEEWL